MIKVICFFYNDDEEPGTEEDFDTTIVFELPAVPRIGETVHVENEDGGEIEGQVVDVHHYISVQTVELSVCVSRCYNKLFKKKLRGAIQPE